MRPFANILGAIDCDLEMQRHRGAYIEDKEMWSPAFAPGARRGFIGKVHVGDRHGIYVCIFVLGMGLAESSLANALGRFRG